VTPRSVYTQVVYKGGTLWVWVMVRTGGVRPGRAYKGGVRVGVVRKESGRNLWVRVRAGRAQKTGERALRTGKTGGGVSGWEKGLGRSAKGGLYRCTRGLGRLCGCARGLYGYGRAYVWSYGYGWAYGWAYGPVLFFLQSKEAPYRFWSVSYL
jgi:hypothetical protein